MEQQIISNSVLSGGQLSGELILQMSLIQMRASKKRLCRRSKMQNMLLCSGLLFARVDLDQ
jgi:hypothetical protein